MGKITDTCADKIIESTNYISVPHPSKEGFMVVGWIVPEKDLKIGVVTLALNEISKWWKLSRSFGTR